MSRCVWAVSDDELVEHISSTADPNAKCWLFTMDETLSASEFTRLIVTLWAIWTATRKAIHEEIFQSPLSTHSFVESFLEELRGLESSSTSSSQRSPGEATARTNRTTNRWLLPRAGHAKINVDGA